MNELALRDIHLPDATLWWPPAPGWWLLLVSLVLLVFILPRLWRWMRHRSMKKLSQNAFQQIVEDFQQQQDQRQLVADLSVLLRRILMSYEGRRKTAGLTGSEWISRLNQLVEIPCFSEQQQALLADGQYRKDFEVDGTELIDSCRDWIKALPRRTGYVPV